MSQPMSSEADRLADYAAYSDELARGEGRPDPSDVIVREVPGLASEAELEAIFQGRPRDDVQQPLKTTWQVRASAALDSSVQRLAAQAGMSKSAFIRRTMAELVRSK